MIKLLLLLLLLLLLVYSILIGLNHEFLTLNHGIPGETTFLEALEGDAPLAPSGGVAPGERQTLGAVSPKRGRLLLTLGAPHGHGMLELMRFLADV